MGNIHQLDAHTADLIAAGEVIERAASVVKELVENAIDAGAKRIAVTLEDSGVKSISVRDDGSGMDVSDAHLALLPHATSKISSPADLFRIHTLGFRGEALPSIVAVSDFRMKTSTDGTSGLIYSLRGGRAVSEMSAPLPRGTEITVKNLFFNTPARLQSLGSAAAELAWCIDVVAKASFAHPDISFSLMNNGKSLFMTYGDGNLKDCLGQVYGMNVERGMLDIFGRSNAFTLRGFISMNALTRSTRNYLSFFVNDRAFRSPRLQSALLSGYGTRLMQGRYPIAVLMITTDASLVDVNVHPAKLEVRFSDEKELLDLVEKTVRDRLAGSDMIPQAQLAPAADLADWEDAMPEMREDANEVRVTAVPEANEETPDDGTNLAAVSADAATAEEGAQDAVHPEEVTEEPDARPSSTPASAEAKADTLFTPPASVGDEATEEEAKPVHPPLPVLSYIGQYLGTYIIAQAAEDLYLIDQHAAMERINYERIAQELASPAPQTYELLVPFSLDYSLDQATLVASRLTDIKALGIMLEPFGEHSFAVKAIPLWIPKGREQDIIEEMIDALLADRSTSPLVFVRSLAKTLACKASVKGNTWLSEASVDFILTHLGRCENPYTCPHGRPTLIKFAKNEIDRLFKRLVEE